METSKKPTPPQSAKPSPARPTKTAAITGATGTGKSEKAKQIIKEMGGRNLIITYSGAGSTWDEFPEIPPTQKALEGFKGTVKIMWIKHRLDETPLLLNIFKYYRNGAIIFDDCKQYMKPNIDHTPHLIDICCEHRFRGYDLYFIAHNPLQIPVDAWSYIKNVWVFKCYRRYNENHLNCDNPEKVVAAQKRVAKRYAKADKENKPLWGIYEYAKL